MRPMNILTPVLAAALMSACVSLEGISMPGSDASADSANTARFQCENGYKVLVNYKSADQIVVSFNNGKDTFVVNANAASAASGEYYENDAKTLTWHEKKGTAVFTYPASDYKSSGKIMETVCTRN